MAIQHLVIACSSTPASVAGNALHGIIRVHLKAIGGTCYLGDSAVTTAGFPLSTGDSPLAAVMAVGEQLFVASSSGSAASLGVLRMWDTT